MICKKCNGKGYIYTNAFGINGKLRCDVCGGNGKILSNQMTNEEWLRSATFEELAGAIYEWHTKGYARGRLEVDLNPITEVVEWLKQPHTKE